MADELTVKVVEDDKVPVGQQWVSLDQSEVWCNPADAEQVRRSIRDQEEAVRLDSNHKLS